VSSFLTAHQQQEYSMWRWTDDSMAWCNKDVKGAVMLALNRDNCKQKLICGQSLRSQKLTKWYEL